ncbi:MAG: acyl-CoA dehydratase activase, partial [Atribacterota bacterium]|nr:acyl-CoA dehydratase activase [Atribacterota bacterium]
MDVGAVSTDLVLLDEYNNVVSDVYLRTQGQPIKMIKKGLSMIKEQNHGISLEVIGVGTTGSGRVLAGAMAGADVVKNEITAHAVAALYINPQVRTIFEIGGQDSKIIILQNGVVVDFAMNTICAAGTGSFLDHQAFRLGIPIEEFGDYALKANSFVRIAGRCTVFAESDMVHKQQMGYKEEEIIAGLCEAMVRNYL